MRLGSGGKKGFALAGFIAGLCAATVALAGVDGGTTSPQMSPIALAVDSRRVPEPAVSASPGVKAVAPATTAAPQPTAPAAAQAAAAAPAPAPAPRPSVVPPPTAPRPARAPKAKSSATPSTLPPGKGGTWAVVLGVDDYGGSGNLKAGVADANEIVATMLDSGVPGENILLLRNWEVTPASIIAAADWLVDRVGEDGLAVFAWAGHIRAVDNDTEALATGNGGLVTDATLASHLSKLRASRSWFLIAGCYGGGFTELLGPGRVLTAASRADQQAYENTYLGHSYLVEYVVRRGLHRGEGPKVVSGSVSWAQQRIRKEHPGREPVEYVSGPVEPFVLGPNPNPSSADGVASSPS